MWPPATSTVLPSRSRTFLVCALVCRESRCGKWRSNRREKKLGFLRIRNPQEARCSSIAHTRDWRANKDTACMCGVCILAHVGAFISGWVFICQVDTNTGVLSLSCVYFSVHMDLQDTALARGHAGMRHQISWGARWIPSPSQVPSTIKCHKKSIYNSVGSSVGPLAPPPRATPQLGSAAVSCQHLPRTFLLAPRAPALLLGFKTTTPPIPLPN
jgi:hypothetical protein